MTVALVTGASRGIGAATARACAAAGYDVVVNYRADAAGAEQVAAGVRAQSRRAVTVAADVADENQVLALFAAVDDFGPLTALVNNAGIIQRQMRLREMTVERINRVLATNVTGALLCAREAVQRMGKGGAIVNVSSVAARLGGPFEYVDYAASKGALDSFTVGLAKEVAAEGIRVNAVRPGIIDTDIHASGGEPGRVARLASSVPLGRGGSAEEVAAAIVWLLSDAASYVTGSFIEVSGGR